MSRTIYCRPVTCDHNTEIAIRTYLWNEAPLYTCGCRAVLLDMSRMYRPRSPEVIDLTCNSDTELLDIEEIIDLVDESDQRQENQRLASWREEWETRTRQAISNCLSEPHKITLAHFRSDEPMSWGEFIDQHPYANVLIDWVIMHRFSVEDPDNTDFVVCCRACSLLRSVVRDFHFVAQHHQSMRVDFDSDGTLSLPCDVMPKHYIASQYGNIRAAKFEIVGGGQSSSMCWHCFKSPYTVVGPFDCDNVVFTNSRSSHIGSGWLHANFDL